MLMTGPKTQEDGSTRMGIYTNAEICAWITDKIGKAEARARESSMKSVVNDFMSSIGKATSGPDRSTEGLKSGAVKTSIYRAKEVRHTSAGKKNQGHKSGMTLFYVAGKGEDGRIIGVGYHLNSSSYGILWNRSDWHVGKTVTLA